MNSVLASFESEAALRRALARLDAEHIGAVETYMAIALDEHAAGSPLPLLMFISGVLGFVGFFALMAYADLWAYPLDIGGRPDFAWPSFTPIAFELGVLCAMGVGFFGFFALCRMPRPYETVDECEGFRRASRDGWFVAVRSLDSDSLVQARAAFKDLRATRVEEFDS